MDKEREDEIKKITDLAAETKDIAPETFVTVAEQLLKDIPATKLDLPQDKKLIDDVFQLKDSIEKRKSEQAKQSYIKSLKLNDVAAEDSWIKYLQILQSTHEVQPDSEPIIDPTLSSEFNRLFQESGVGKYMRISPKEQKKYLPEGWCGKLEEREFTNTNENSILIRNQTFDLVQKLDNARLQHFAGFKPILLHGDSGVGKSAVLQSIVYWARKSDWLVINIRNATKWVHSGGIIQKSQLIEDCWDQPYSSS